MMAKGEHTYECTYVRTYGTDPISPPTSSFLPGDNKYMYITTRVQELQMVPMIMTKILYFRNGTILYVLHWSRSQV